MVLMVGFRLGTRKMLLAALIVIFIIIIIIIIIIILMHGIAHYSIHSGGPYMDFSFFSQSTCYFYAVLHI